jgi:threonine dehydrogenase-like Zn-dependent dehydrogenase
MRALALDFAARAVVEYPQAEPAGPGPGEALLRIRAVGVCGTDRELIRFRFGAPPEGESHLILGHEAWAEVMSAGAGVTRLAPGDLVVPAIRRSCAPPCRACQRGRRDLCRSGGYRERGITGAHGYFQAFAVDAVEDLFVVPAALRDHAVLVEPLSVVEKAIEAGVRAHPDGAESALVIGAGPVGLLAALTLHAAGLRVSVFSLEAEDDPRLEPLRRAGIEYARQSPSPADLILEATGSSDAAQSALEFLNPAGVLVLLGAPRLETVDALGMIVRNQSILGVVNSAPNHFEQAIADLRAFDPSWVEPMIERRAPGAWRSSLAGPGAAPKTIHVFDS